MVITPYYFFIIPHIVTIIYDQRNPPQEAAQKSPRNSSGGLRVRSQIQRIYPFKLLSIGVYPILIIIPGFIGK
jgi:hypothetical protein